MRPSIVDLDVAWHPSMENRRPTVCDRPAARSRDKRSTLFTLSAATRARSVDIAAAIATLNHDALAGISPSDRDRLRHALSAIAASVEQALERSA